MKSLQAEESMKSAIWSGIIAPPGKPAISLQIGATYLEDFLRKVALKHNLADLAYVSFYDGEKEVSRVFTILEVAETLNAIGQGVVA